MLRKRRSCGGRPEAASADGEVGWGGGGDDDGGDDGSPGCSGS